MKRDLWAKMSQRDYCPIYRSSVLPEMRKQKTHDNPTMAWNGMSKLRSHKTDMDFRHLYCYPVYDHRRETEDKTSDTDPRRLEQRTGTLVNRLTSGVSRNTTVVVD